MHDDGGEQAEPDLLESNVQRTVAGFSPRALLNARRAAGWSIAELAVVSGVPSTVLAGWERGAHQPTVTRLRAAAEALGLEVRDLLRASAADGGTLTDLRVARGLSLVEAAKAAGIHDSTLSRAERGAPLTERVQLALAAAYQCSESEIGEAWALGREAIARRLRAKPRSTDELGG